MQKKYCERKLSVRKTKQNRLMLLSNCSISGKRKYQCLLKIKNSIKHLL